ncbi:hypothetical protein LA080_002182 [Diaporthe eres]|nr:hypothetical protein LA080_002182 [Diaporthe eres]
MSDSNFQDATELNTQLGQLCTEETGAFQPKYGHLWTEEGASGQAGKNPSNQRASRGLVSYPLAFLHERLQVSQDPPCSLAAYLELGSIM